MAKHLDKIRAAAKHQAGVFATYQVDVPNQVIHYHAKNENLERIRTGIYRVADFPRSDDEEYVVAHLWSEQQGVLSHQTALSLHRLSDVLPNKIHLTVPRSWEERDKKVPESYRLHYEDLADEDTQWYDAVPMTTPLRTLKDVAQAGLDPDLVEQAIDQARERGLVGDEVERRMLRFLILQRTDGE
jgi:predicted transcriptional regulator of viral defense system